MDFQTLNKIEISGSKMWGGIWINTHTRRGNQIIWVREDAPNSHPLGHNNIQNGINNGLTVTVIN